LSSTLLPVASAGATFHAAISKGKFHGTIAATTPSGSCVIMPSSFCPVGAIWSKTLSMASAVQSKQRTLALTSTAIESPIGLPMSSVSSSANSTLWRSISDARRCSFFLRSTGEALAQEPSSNARRPAATARSTSSGPHSLTLVRIRPSIGLTQSKVLPEAAST
jgi:hypothetical protein